MALLNQRLFLGDGVFRTMRLLDGKIENRVRHFEKLSLECSLLGINPTLPEETELDDFIQENKALKGLFRLKISIVAKDRRDLTLLSKVKGEAYLSIEPYAANSSPMTLTVFKEPFHRLNYQVKSISFLDQLSLLSYAKESGFDEVLTLSPEGYVLEGATCNLFWKEGDALCFVDPALPYYKGLTQELMIEDALKGKKEVKFCKARPEDLEGKQLFLCNSLKGTIPVNLYKVNL